MEVLTDMKEALLPLRWSAVGNKCSRHSTVQEQEGKSLKLKPAELQRYVCQIRSC